MQISGLPETLKKDFPASIAPFFVTATLCLGISIASAAPEHSGLIVGIIGGVFVGFLSGFQTSVSGPATGKVTVVLSSVENWIVLRLLLWLQLA